MQTPEPAILPLANAAPSLLYLAGGKAANLSELIRAGFKVPDGFCITTAAYREVTGLAQVKPILAELPRLPVENLEGRAAWAEQLRQRIQAAPILADLAQAISSAYEALGPNVPVAVRSSATAEDLAEAAFAGQQDTFLNIVGTDTPCSTLCGAAGRPYGPTGPLPTARAKALTRRPWPWRLLFNG